MNNISLHDRTSASPTDDFGSAAPGPRAVNNRFAHNLFEKKQKEVDAREARMKALVDDPRRALYEVHWLSPICGLTALPECDECSFQDDEDGSLMPCDGQSVIDLDLEGIFRFEERTYGRCPYCRRGTMVHLPFVPEGVRSLRRQCLAWIQEEKCEEPVDTQTGFEAILKAAIKSGRGLRSVEWDRGMHLRIDHEGRLRLITPDGESSPTLLTAEALLHSWQLV